jgi:hypothetical protein
LAVVVVTLAFGLACSPPRVLVVGLDGATWKVIEPLVEAGYLPTIGALVRAGARFDLDCVPANASAPCFCPPVWTSIATGHNVAGHRIANFHTPSSERGVKALWNVVDEYGGRSTLISFRGTWPPESAAELVITEPGAQVFAAQLYDVTPQSSHPGAAHALTHTRPVDLFERLDMGPDPRPPGSRLPAWLPLGEDRVSMEAALRIARLQADVPADERVPDLTLILLHAIDRSEHVMWQSVQREQWGPFDVETLLRHADAWDGPVFLPPPFHWGTVPAQYLEADAWLAELLATLTYDYVVLVSDHGMTANSVPGLAGSHDSAHPEAHVGILSLTGIGIVRGRHLGTATVLDVAPTVAYLLGLPVSRSLPGRVLTEAIEPDRLVTLPIAWVDTWE